MSEEVFEIMRSAVTTARNNQIRSLATLRSILRAKLPDQDAQIEEAISAWAQYEQRKDGNGY